MNSENSVALTCVRDVKMKIGHKHDASNDLSDFQEDVASGLCYISSNAPNASGVPHLQQWYIKYVQKNAYLRAKILWFRNL